MEYFVNALYITIKTENSRKLLKTRIDKHEDIDTVKNTVKAVCMYASLTVLSYGNNSIYQVQAVVNGFSRPRFHIK